MLVESGTSKVVSTNDVSLSRLASRSYQKADPRSISTLYMCLEKLMYLLDREVALRYDISGPCIIEEERGCLSGSLHT